MTYSTKREKDLAAIQPPQSLDAEQALLGAILKDSEALTKCIEVFDDAMVFYSPKHRFIFEAMLALYEKSEPCDITTIADHLIQQNKLDSIGGRVYLVDLAEGIVSTANVTSYANIVLEKSLLRRLINTSNDIVQSCYSMEQPVDVLLDQAESTIFSISEKRLRKGFTPLKNLIQPTVEQIEHMQNSDEEYPGLKTGFTKIDEMTLGLHSSDLVIIAGRPSMGKTSLALNIAENVALESKTPVGVGVFSIEMSAEQLALRMLCSRAGVSQQKVRAGKLNDEEWGRITHRGGLIGNAPIYIDDSPTLTPLEMRAKARRLKAQYDVGLIIVDYIQLMSTSGRVENRQQEMSQISRSMKALAKELEIPVIAISQLSRQVEQRGGEKRPQLSDLRESGAIEQDADLVMFVYREAFYMVSDEDRAQMTPEQEKKAEIIIAKQRNGPTGAVELVFIKEFTKFGNPDYAHRELPPGAQPVENDHSSGPPL